MKIDRYKVIGYKIAIENDAYHLMNRGDDLLNIVIICSNNEYKIVELINEKVGDIVTKIVYVEYALLRNKDIIIKIGYYFNNEGTGNLKGYRKLLLVLSNDYSIREHIQIKFKDDDILLLNYCGIKRIIKGYARDYGCRFINIERLVDCLFRHDILEVEHTIYKLRDGLYIIGGYIINLGIDEPIMSYVRSLPLGSGYEVVGYCNKGDTGFISYVSNNKEYYIDLNHDIIVREKYLSGLKLKMNNVEKVII